MIRPEQASDDAGAPRSRRVCVVTGSRAEYGLLRPVMRAIQKQPGLDLFVVAAGSHLIQPALTFREVKADFEVADSVPMQVAGRRSRLDDAEAVGAGISRFTRSFRGLEPDWVVVLGDRIEAFAAASAASIAGIGVAHIHGGDRAEGVADESMRHAITKLAHLHLPATAQSAERIERMGERKDRIRLVGSPAIDELAEIDTLDDEGFAALGSPDVVFLMHPVGKHDEDEEATAAAALDAIGDTPALLLHPNQDPGRNGMLRAIKAHDERSVKTVVREHLKRETFVGLLKRIAGSGVLVGNSSAALIEAAALGVASVDIGPRQAGRERPASVVHVDRAEAAREALSQARAIGSVDHPYGDGTAGAKIAEILAEADATGLLRKRNTY